MGKQALKYDKPHSNLIRKKNLNLLIILANMKNSNSSTGGIVGKGTHTQIAAYKLV